MNQGLQDLVHAGGYGNDESGGIGGDGGDDGVAKVALVALRVVLPGMEGSGGGVVVRGDTW